MPLLQLVMFKPSFWRHQEPFFFQSHGGGFIEPENRWFGIHRNYATLVIQIDWCVPISLGRYTSQVRELNEIIVLRTRSSWNQFSWIMNCMYAFLKGRIDLKTRFRGQKKKTSKQDQWKKRRCNFSNQKQKLSCCKNKLTNQ